MNTMVGRSTARCNPLPQRDFLHYFVMSMAETNCARWRRESVPVGLRGKGCEAPVSFEQRNVIGLLVKSTYCFSRVLSGAVS
jgi:hypothetical protein